MTGSVVYVLPNTMGGMLNIVDALVEHGDPEALPSHVVLTDNANIPDARFRGTFRRAASSVVVHHQLPVENLHSVLRRLREAIPRGPGVLVCNDLLELALLHVWDPQRMVVQILHGDHDYYYELATRHESVVDVFITYSRAIHAELLARLPHRAGDVRYEPYGVTLPCRRRTPAPSNMPLRAVFAGRLGRMKGVLDLPRIDAELQQRGVVVDWTIIGDGPEGDALRAMWARPDVAWRGALPREELLEILPDFDVFVLPTRAEGFPLALVEAMGAGLVPVVSDLPSGVPELVDAGVEGFRPAVGDTAGFAHAIAALHGNRELLETMSGAAARRVLHLDPRERAAAYERVFGEWRSHARVRRRRTKLPYGSRLDRPWLPNAFVRSVRTATRGWRARR